MYMFVNDTGQNETPRDVHLLLTGTTGHRSSVRNLCYATILYEEIALKRAAFIDDDTTFYQ